MSSIKRIVILKYCAIGDLIFLSPMIRTLKENFSEIEIALVAYSSVADLASCIYGVDKVFVSDFPAIKNLFKKAFSALHLLRDIRKYRAEILFVGHRNRLFGFFGLLTGIPTRIGFETNIFLHHAIPYNASIHESDRYLNLLKPLNIVKFEKLPLLVTSSKRGQQVHNKLLEKGINDSEKVIVIFPGGGSNVLVSMPIKRWGKDRFIKLIHLIQQTYLYPVILIGSCDEFNLCQEIANQCDGVINFAGDFTIPELIELGQFTALMIGGDSGPTHLLAATGVPTISIFGPSDPRLVAPRGTNQVYVWSKINCAPCYRPDTAPQAYRTKNGKFLCENGGRACMEKVLVEQVWEAVKAILL